MKKLIVFAVVVLVMVLGMQSCKSTQDCPAYGKVSPKQTSQRA